MKRKIPKIVIYMIIIGLSLLLGVILGYTPSVSLNGFFSFSLIGIWISYTVGIIIRIKKLREYHSTLNSGLLIFGNLFTSAIFGIWGDFTPILSEKVFPGTILQINFWIIIFSLPYLIFGMILLLFSITKYFSIYFGSKAFNARKYTIFMGVIFLVFDLIYVLISQGIISFEFWNSSSFPGNLNIFIIVHMAMIVFFAILGVITRNRSMSRYNLDELTSRMNDIDRRINDADHVSAAARRSEQRARDIELIQQRRREREAQRRSGESRRQKQTDPITVSRLSHKSGIKPNTVSAASTLSKKELLKMKPKAGKLAKEDFMCIFCFQMPSMSDIGPGVVICPHCKYPAHYDEFMEWVRNSKLCSRCDGVLPSNFIRNPPVIPTKIYLKAYKYFKKQF